MGTSITYSGGGAAAATVQTLAATGSVTAWNSIVTGTSAGATTFTLPDALASKIGQSITVRNEGTGAITVAQFAGDTLSGQTIIGAGGAVTYTVTADGVVTTSQDIAPATTATPITSVVGWFDTGDIGGGTLGAMPVGGQVISAVKASNNGGNTFTVTIPNMGNTTYPLWIYTEGLGAFPWDSASTSLIVGHTKTASTFNLYMKADDEVFLAGAQNIRVWVYAMSALPTSTSVVVAPGAAAVITDVTLATGTDANVASAAAVKAYVDENTKAPNVVQFAASGTYTASAGLKWAEVELVGGGGGGGGAGTTNAAGEVAVGGSGGGGGYIRAILTAAQLGASQAITVGAAGAAGAAGGAGGTGGTTSVGALLLCAGGGGGVAGAARAGVSATTGANGGGITPTVGSIIVNRQGEQAGPSMGVVVSTNVSLTSANGGNSPLGRGGKGLSLGTSGATAAGSVGNAATGFGAGGSGAVNAGTLPPARAGSLGAPGKVIITEFF